MPDEIRVSRWSEIISDLVEAAGAAEFSSILPSAEVVDAAPVDLPADYIRVVGRSGNYEPALKIPGMTYSVGDRVILLYVRGTEAIALSKSPGSSGGVGGWPFDNILTVDSVDPDADYTTIAAALAAVADGDMIVMNSETFVENLVISFGLISLGCFGPLKFILEGTILLDNCEEVVVLFNIDQSLDIDDVVATAAIDSIESLFRAYCLNIYAYNDTGDSIAIRVNVTGTVSGYDAELHDCVAEAESYGGDSYALYVEDGTVLVDSGRYKGDTAAIYVEQGATVYLLELPMLTGGLAGGGTVIGPYQDENGIIRNSSGGVIGAQIFPTTADIWGEDITSIDGDTAQQAVATAQFYNTYTRQVPGSSGDIIERTFFLAEGTYNVYILGIEDTDCGIATWSIDGTNILVGDDWYAGATSYNSVTSIVNVVISGNGIHTIRSTITGNNGGSSGYKLKITKITILPPTIYL